MTEKCMICDGPFPPETKPPKPGRCLMHACCEREAYEALFNQAKHNGELWTVTSDVPYEGWDVYIDKLNSDGFLD